MVKGGKNGSNTFGEGWGTFPPTFPPPKVRIWRDLGVGRPAATTCCCSGRGGVRERKGGWGRRGRRGPRILALSRQPAWRGRLVAPVHVARQRGPRQSQRGHTVGPPGHLSRQWCWHDKPTLSRHCVPKPSKDCIFHLVAWQLPLVAPLRMARQSSFVAPPGVARQAYSAAPLCAQAL